MVNTRKKLRTCIVCGQPSVGRQCRDCYHVKNNRIAGRYKISLGYKRQLLKQSPMYTDYIGPEILDPQLDNNTKSDISDE